MRHMRIFPAIGGKFTSGKYGRKLFQCRQIQRAECHLYSTLQLL